MSECLFCKIIAGQIPAFKIMEDSETLAFLDINPAAPGHTLVVPKKHAKDIFEADEDSVRAVAVATKKVADMIRKSLGTDVSVLQNNGRAAGQAIDHLHVHVIPRRAGDRIPLVHMGARASEATLIQMHKTLTTGKSVESRARDALSDWEQL